MYLNSGQLGDVDVEDLKNYMRNHGITEEMLNAGGNDI
jgi:hypothetical protein